MKSTLLKLPLLTAILALGPAARFQTLTAAGSGDGGLPAATVAVVTTDGFFVPDPGSSVPDLFIADSSFPDEPEFKRPAVQWEPNSDSFLVASGDQLFRVTIQSLDQDLFTIDDITPASAAPMNLYDLDVNPGTGELYLLDQTTKTVERFQAPYAQGMTSNLSIPIPPTTRSIALDSRSIPPTLIAGETTQVTRVYFDGSTEDVSFMLFPSGVDQDPQNAGVLGTYMCSSENTIGLATTTPGLLVSMNYLDFCAPLAVAPEDVEWDPIERRVFALAEDGVNLSPACPDLASGPNHVLRFPMVQIPGLIEPTLYTFHLGSGITGEEGDLAIVYDDFAFVTPYGEGCVDGAGDSGVLDVVQLPVSGISALTFELHDPAPLSPALLVAGFQRVSIPLPSGCLLLVSPDFVFSMGTTDAQGELSFGIPVSPGIPVGIEVFLQSAVAVGGGWRASQGLMVRFGL